MPVPLFLVPTIDAALDHALREVYAAQQRAPLEPVTLLLPGVEALRGTRQRLSNSLGVRLLEFYRLADLIVDEANHPVREVSRAATRRLVQTLLEQMRAEGYLSTFNAVASMPGFIQSLVEWIREMKSQGITPEQVAYEARKSGSERDRQLALLYERYQSFLLENSYSDVDGLLWVAADLLDEHPELLAHDGPFLVLGFDQFNPVQLRILQSLSERVRDFALYLVWDQARPVDSLALTRLRDTRKQIEATLNTAAVTVEAAGESAPILAHLRQTLFEPVEARSDDSGVVQAVAAPSREGEVRSALRSIKQRLMEGVAPERIALLAPGPAIYHTSVRAVASEYGIPISCDVPLMQNPAVAALYNLLQLAPDFPWRETFDALRSPYFDIPWLNAEQIDALERLTRQRPVLGGRDEWRFALRPRPTRDAEREDDDEPVVPRSVEESPDLLAAIQEGLIKFFDHVTPPERATHGAYAWWIQEAILGLFPEYSEDSSPAGGGACTLDVVSRCRQGRFPERDIAAIAEMLRLFRVLEEAAALVPSGLDDRVSWDSYREEVFSLMRGAVLRGRPGGVPFSALESARARVVDHLYILGLSEGEFPRTPAPDPFYTLNERLSHSLPLIIQDPAEEASLWWQVLSNCRQSLTMLRPRIDEGGAPWLPSAYWDAVINRIEGLEHRIARPTIGAIPSLDEAACTSELMLALASRQARRVPLEVRPLWKEIHRGVTVLSARQGSAPPGPYEGVLDDPVLRDHLARRFGTEYIWSASKLNRYGRCPYGFFARDVLWLDPLADPSEGLDPAQRGSVLHAVLEKLHGRMSSAGLACCPADQEAVMALLEESCDSVMSSAPSRFGFRPSGLWWHEQGELRRLLRALVSWECEQGKGDYRSFAQEVAFTLLLPGRAQPFFLRGYIDRIDRDAEGRARIVDYKSGQSLYTENDILSGIAFQTALYALAAEALDEVATVRESYYLHLPIRKPSGALYFDGPVIEDGKVMEALDLASRFIERIQRGWFPSVPAKATPAVQECWSGCPYSALCRASWTGTRKARQFADSDTPID